MLRSFASLMIFLLFSSQLIASATKSSCCKSMSGCKKTGSTSSWLFLDRMASITPCSFIFLRSLCVSLYLAPSLLSDNWTPSTPSSPITPPQRVLSRSTAIHFFFLPLVTVTYRRINSCMVARPFIEYGMEPIYHILGE